MARSSSRSLFLVVFFLLACGFLGILFAQRAGQQSSITGDTDVRDSFKQFTDVYSLVEENYAEPVNADKAIYNGAIPGMLHALDPHSNFFDPKSYSLMREDVEKPMEFTLVRDEIPRYSVDVHFLLKPGVGYMHVTGFNETTEHEVAEALDQFGDLKGLILDLRGNPGGLLSEGVGVADKF